MGGSVILAVFFALWAMPGIDEEVLTGLEESVRSAPRDLKAGNDYRSAIRLADDPDRAIRFLSSLLDQNRDSSAFRVNLALAYVDKLSRPGMSNMKRGVLSSRSIGHLNAALAIDPTSWVALYSRGMNHLYWPRLRGHTPAAIRDFKACLALQEGVELQDHFLFPYVTLGDAYVKNGEPEAGREVWRQGLIVFPGEAVLVERLALDDQAVATLVEQERAKQRPISTDLSYLTETDP